MVVLTGALFATVMAFRLSYNGQGLPLASTPASTVEELMAEIRDITGVLPSRQDISFGFPRRQLPVDAKSLPLTLQEIGVGRREMFTLVEKAKGDRADAAPKHMASALTEAIQFNIPGDNSCLFNSISYLCTGSANRGPELRQVVVKAIRENPSLYTAATLGCSPDEYCKWIIDPMHWGGYIEIGILSRHFDVEIYVLHIEECKGMPVNTNDSKRRIFILYDNIHYDAVFFRGFGVEERRIVDVKDEVAVALAMDLCRILNRAGSFTNPKTCMLKCDACGKVCQGQAEAERHGKQTGHAHFSAFNG